MKLMSNVRKACMLGVVPCLVSLIAGCDPNGGLAPLATIKYHQVGACNGYKPTSASIVSVGPNAAYVIFNIESVDNTKPVIDFNFDPARLYISKSPAQFVDTNLQLAKDLGVFSTVPITVPKGQFVGINGYSVVVAVTGAVDGAVEANMTNYFLNYDTQPSGPGVILVKSNSSQTSFPLTRDCLAVTLK